MGIMTPTTSSSTCPFLYTQPTEANYSVPSSTFYFPHTFALETSFYFDGGGGILYYDVHAYCFYGLLTIVVEYLSCTL